MSESENNLTLAAAYSEAVVATDRTALMPLDLDGRSQVRCDDDAISAWLAVFKIKNISTARSYESQSRKFRLFLRLLHPERPNDHQIKMANEGDVAAYEAALSHRPFNGLSVSALRLTGLQMQELHLRSQPFEAPLKRSSVNQALAVIHAMYDFLRQPNAVMREPYVSVNPARRVLKAGNRTPRKIDRVLPGEAIGAMQDYLHLAMGTATAVGEKSTLRHLQRKQWMLTLLFGLWTRRAEVCKLSMGDFRQSQSFGQWYVDLERKGGREQSIPIPDWVIERLRQYRQSLGMPTQWAAGDLTPALLDVRYRPGKHARGVTPNTLYEEIRALACETANEIEAQMLLKDVGADERSRIVDALRRCSPHWFRHTGPTIAINSGMMSLTNASNLLGHSSTATTTLMYHHADDKQTREGMEALGQLMRR